MFYPRLGRAVLYCDIVKCSAFSETATVRYSSREQIREHRTWRKADAVYLNLVQSSCAGLQTRKRGGYTTR